MARNGCPGSACPLADTVASPLRILVIASYLPYPPDAGSSIRIFNLIRHLARRQEVTLLAHAVPREAWKVAALQELGIRVETVAAPSRLRAPDLIGTVTRRQARRATARQVAHTFLPSSLGRTRLVLRESGFSAPEHHQGNSEGWDTELAKVRSYLEGV